jgi:hypothetical protein
LINTAEALKFNGSGLSIKLEGRHLSRWPPTLNVLLHDTRWQAPQGVHR